MTLYKVEVTEERTWIIWVDAEDKHQAADDAEELAATFDADDYETDAYAYEPRDPKIDDDTDVWVGGEDGEFITYAEYKERAKS